MGRHNKRLWCRFCPWSTPLFVGKRSGWSLLVDHVFHEHEDVEFNAFLAMFGTTVRGMDALERVREAE